MTQKSNSYLLSLLQGSVTFFHSFHYCYSQMLRLTLRQKLLPLLWLKRTERVAQDGGEDDGGEGEGPEDVAAAPLQPANQGTAVQWKRSSWLWYGRNDIFSPCDWNWQADNILLCWFPLIKPERLLYELCLQSVMSSDFVFLILSVAADRKLDKFQPVEQAVPPAV